MVKVLVGAVFEFNADAGAVRAAQIHGSGHKLLQNVSGVFLKNVSQPVHPLHVRHGIARMQAASGKRRVGFYVDHFDSTSGELRNGLTGGRLELRHTRLAHRA